MSKNICIIPGAFDPVTNGHFDFILRASKLFDIVYVTAFDNSAKKTMFTLEERREMLSLACEGIENVRVDATNQLLVGYAELKGADYIVKGVRNSKDFEYENDMSMINRAISDNKIETLFLPAKTENLYISSTFVREMIAYKRDISNYVPAKVNGFINGLMEGRMRGR